MDKIHFIRQLYYEQGKDISAIIAETGHDRKTVCKHIDMADFNTPDPEIKNPENICPMKDRLMIMAFSSLRLWKYCSLLEYSEFLTVRSGFAVLYSQGVKLTYKIKVEELFTSRNYKEQCHRITLMQFGYLIKDAERRDVR